MFRNIVAGGNGLEGERADFARKGGEGGGVLAADFIGVAARKGRADALPERSARGMAKST
jgi:hypothetical protein